MASIAVSVAIVAEQEELDDKFKIQYLYLEACSRSDLAEIACSLMQSLLCLGLTSYLLLMTIQFFRDSVRSVVSVKEVFDLQA